jgi:hypothetical protein
MKYDTRSENDYEELRSFALGGIALQTGKELGLATIIANGTAAWARNCNELKIHGGIPRARNHQNDHRHCGDIVAVLIANLLELKAMDNFVMPG